MLLFGHVGIAIGVGLLARHVVDSRTYREAHDQEGRGGISAELDSRAIDESRFPVRRLFDLRLFILGSMLPDLVDKPLILFTGNGRMFAHTLLFAALLLAAGLYAAISRNKMGLLAVSLGAFLHLILDSMWQTPETLLWPLLGWDFNPPYHEGDVAGGILEQLLHNPWVYVPEAVGLLITGGYLWTLIRAKYREGANQLL